MSNTLKISLPVELLERLKEKSRITGLPMGRLVRLSLEATLSDENEEAKPAPWMKYAGILKDGPRDLSSRRGYSRK